jgi:DNA polymerase III delta subunit
VPVKGFYFTYGDDSEMLEKKWLPDLQKKYQGATWLRYDASVDEIQVAKLVTEYNSHNLFDNGKVICIRNVDSKPAQIEALATAFLEQPNPVNALVLIAGSWNKATKLGKLVKKSFIVRDFIKPEFKPFALLDCLNSKNTARVLHQCNKLFTEDYSPLAMYSLLCGHFSLLKQIKQHQNKSPEEIARVLKQHQFRVKKAMVAFRYWNEQEITEALQYLSYLGDLLRSWQHDEKMLLQMALIKLCI